VELALADALDLVADGSIVDMKTVLLLEWMGHHYETVTIPPTR
jgi:hypothetical protein